MIGAGAGAGAGAGRNILTQLKTGGTEGEKDKEIARLRAALEKIANHYPTLNSPIAKIAHEALAEVK